MTDLREENAELRARILEQEHHIALLVEQLQSAASDKQKLEARLRELLAKRRAIEETPRAQLLLAFVGEVPLPTPPCAKEAPDGETPEDELRGRGERKGRKNHKRQLFRA